jgi:Fe2+ or Zn2+ uptake regulation protein
MASQTGVVLDEVFRSAALRRTPQRYAVLQFLVRTSLHATAEEIFHSVNRKDPRASRATVYNSLLAGSAALGSRAVRNYEVIFRGTCGRCGRRPARGGKRV